MFCTKCGAKITDDMVTCPSCGCQIGQQIVTGVQDTMQAKQQEKAVQDVPQVQQQIPSAAVQPRAAKENEMGKNLLAQFKAFFSDKPTRGVDIAAKSKSMEWIVYLGTYFVVLVLSVALTLYGAMKGLFFYGGPNFGSCLLRALSIPVFAEGATFGAVYLYMAVIQKNKVNIMSVLNIVGYSFIPMILVAVANMLLGLIWLPFVVVAYVVGIFARSMLLYYAIRKSGEGKRFSQPIYFGVYAATKTLIVACAYLMISI